MRFAQVRYFIEDFNLGFFPKMVEFQDKLVRIFAYDVDIGFAGLWKLLNNAVTSEFL